MLVYSNLHAEWDFRVPINLTVASVLKCHKQL
jgi:hypothetical protein